MQATVFFHGTLQGTQFLRQLYVQAVANGLTGFVQPHADGSLEVHVSGWEKSIEAFIETMTSDTPPHAIITRHSLAYEAADGPWTKFELNLGDNQVEEPGSNIPNDYAICGACLDELRDPRNRRYKDPFITCNDCGPRYSINRGLPFNRDRTSFSELNPCPACRREQGNPDDRRYMHQIISCPTCNPPLRLYDDKGDFVAGDPIATAASLLNEGALLAVRGYNGFHVFADAASEGAVQKLRRFKHIQSRPIPVLVPRLENVFLFAQLDEREKTLLTSPERPIVILPKNDPFPLSPDLSPKLSTIGVMMPVYGLHLLILDEVRTPAIAFTSGNPLHEPPILDQQEAIQRLTGVDYFLSHDLPLISPIDDSIVQLVEDHRVLLRRSRGYAPHPISLKWKTEEAVLALGAALETTGCYLFNDHAFLSTSTANLATRRAQQEITAVTRRLVETIAIPPALVAYSSNSSYEQETSTIINAWVKEYDAKAVDIPHDAAHIIAIANEYHINHLIGACLDGPLPPLIPQPSGGNIYRLEDQTIEYVTGLQLLPFPSPSALTENYPLSAVTTVLPNSQGIEEWVQQLKKLGQLAGAPLKDLSPSKSSTPMESAQYVLDLASAVLGVCPIQSFPGESALQLEAAAKGGKDVLGLTPFRDGTRINTRILLEELYNRRNNLAIRDLAYSSFAFLGKCFGALANAACEAFDIPDVGLGGGLVHHPLLVEHISRLVKDANRKLYICTQIPPGDGGLAFGQALGASRHYQITGPKITTA